MSSGDTHKQLAKLVPIDSNFHQKNILSLRQFDKKSLEKLFNATSDYKAVQDRRDMSEVLKGKVVTLLFFEPSSRTRGSFEAAIKYLGGQTILVENPLKTSSVAKGETLEDTARTFASFSDAIVIRHPDVGAAQKVANVVNVPVINAGDGIGEHPTQALLDLFTIKEQKSKLEGLRGLIAGDLKNGRTVHSLLQGLSVYKNNEVYLLSPGALRLTEEIKKQCGPNIKLHEIERVEDIPADCDFWYWTRVQKERFANEEDYQSVSNRFILNKKLINEYAGKKTIFMHPLPRVGEIAEEVDSDPRALYFREQIPNGLFIRMALLTLILSS